MWPRVFAAKRLSEDGRILDAWENDCVDESSSSTTRVAGTIASLDESRRGKYEKIE